MIDVVNKLYLNGADNILGQDGDEHGLEREPEEAAGESDDRLFVVLCLAVVVRDLLRLEQLGVRLELEKEVGDVGEQHDDAAGAGEVEPRGVRCHGVLAGAHRVAQHERQRLAQHAEDEKPRADVRLCLHKHSINISSSSSESVSWVATCIHISCTTLAWGVVGTHPVV